MPVFGTGSGSAAATVAAQQREGGDDGLHRRILALKTNAIAQRDHDAAKG